MSRRNRIAIAGGAAVLLVVLLANGGRILVTEELRKADAILVLEGETDRRPARGIELLRQGYAPRLVLDAAGNYRFYNRSEVELVEQFVRTLPPEEARAISICPISAQSTREETLDAKRCLDAVGARTVLLVTNDYHSRRALSIFRRQLPGKTFGVAAVRDPREFGTAWWKRRQWAKRAFDEWIRLLWWEVVERW